MTCRRFWGFTMQTKRSWLPWFIIGALVVYMLASTPDATPNPDGRRPRTFLSRIVTVAKAWLLFQAINEEPETPPAQRRYTTDEWHSQYANQTPKREIGPDGFAVLKHGEGF